MTKQEILDAVRALPAEEQEEIIDELTDLVPVEIDAEFLEVLRARQRNPEPGTPADEVFARLRAR